MNSSVHNPYQPPRPVPRRRPRPRFTRRWRKELWIADFMGVVAVAATLGLLVYLATTHEVSASHLPTFFRSVGRGGPLSAFSLSVFLGTGFALVAGFVAWLGQLACTALWRLGRRAFARS